LQTKNAIITSSFNDYNKEKDYQKANMRWKAFL